MRFKKGDYVARVRDVHCSPGIVMVAGEEHCRVCWLREDPAVGHHTGVHSLDELRIINRKIKDEGLWF